MRLVGGVGRDVDAEAPVEVERAGEVGGDDADGVESRSHATTLRTAAALVLEESDV